MTRSVVFCNVLPKYKFNKLRQRGRLLVRRKLRSQIVPTKATTEGSLVTVTGIGRSLFCAILSESLEHFHWSRALPPWSPLVGLTLIGPPASFGRVLPCCHGSHLDHGLRPAMVDGGDGHH
ncbi:hypothetical protein AAFF_G00376350 [Aldrovandia affinis]|uniref:Uncharacterized protein n=1 Tax=Aldrovandia affinis TaxID=143900 RepID=A0AAD7SFL3_9TELE|nr:hypothetical protein AAFF_G00376350 [Aldrovandia affinis]